MLWATRLLAVDARESPPQEMTQSQRYRKQPHHHRRAGTLHVTPGRSRHPQGENAPPGHFPSLCNAVFAGDLLWREGRRCGRKAAGRCQSLRAQRGPATSQRRDDNEGRRCIDFPRRSVFPGNKEKRGEERKVKLVWVHDFARPEEGKARKPPSLTRSACRITSAS